LIETLHEEQNRATGNSPPRHHIETTDRNKVEEAYYHWLEVYFDKTNKSEISDLFYGHTVDTTTCLKCTKTKYAFGYFNSMALHISDKESRAISAQDLVDHYFQEEHIDDFKCDFCRKNVTIVKRSHLYKFPEVLLLFFKRFDYGIYGNSPRKLRTKIILPLNIRLNNLAYNVGQNADYVLTGAVNHYGMINSGHYTATCEKNGKWVGFSDALAVDEHVDDLVKYGSENVYLCSYAKVQKQSSAYNSGFSYR